MQNTLLEHFTHLSDPRIDRTKDHLLLDIVAIAILAVIAGADGWEAFRYLRSIPASYLTPNFCAYPTAYERHDT